MELVNITYNVFELFDEIKKFFSEDILLEISVRQSQITLYFKNDIIPLRDLSKGWWTDVSENPYFVIAEENPAIILPFKDKYATFSENPFLTLNKLIIKISETICKCPALEIVFSDQYLKCYLDKPGLRTDDLKNYEKIFDLEGTLELHSQRPYLLFINENLSGADLYESG